MPTAATTDTTPPATGAGWRSRSTASTMIAPTATSRMPALAIAARMEKRRMP